MRKRLLSKPIQQVDYKLYSHMSLLESKCKATIDYVILFAIESHFIWHLASDNCSTPVCSLLIYGLSINTVINTFLLNILFSSHCIGK